MWTTRRRAFGEHEVTAQPPSNQEGPHGSGPARKRPWHANAPDKPARQALGLGWYAGFLAIAWSVVVGASLMWNMREQREATLEAAKTQARAAFEKDVLYRRWNAMHGGVYVPVTETTPPNPQLKVPERDIETPGGRALTKVNPAYMTRQVHELGAERTGIQGHITSLNPIRPENAADPWETSALLAFENGEVEYDSVEVLRGEDYMRLMRPLITEKGCLKCHAVQGYSEGDIRGGISVSVPMAPLWAIGHAAAVSAGMLHGVLWLLGLGAILLTARHIRQRIRSQRRSEKESRRSQAQYRSLVNNIPGVTYHRAADADWTMHYMSAAVASLTGFPASDFINNAKRTYESVILPEDSPGVERAVTEAAAAGRAWEIEYRVCHKDGSVCWVYEKGHSIAGNDGEIAFLDGFILDITERRQAEAAAAARTVELEQRTTEMEKSRRVAMSMMEDAEQARRAAEQAREALAKSDQAFMDSFHASADATLLIEGETFVDCNERTVEMLRASSKKDVLATHPSELSPETQSDGNSSFDKANVMIAIAFKRGSNRFEWDHRRLDGEVFQVEVTLMPISLFGKQLLYCVWKDISELVEARAAAEQAQKETAVALATTEAIFKATPVGVMVVGRDKRIRRVNQAALRMMGDCSLEEIVDHICHERVCPTKEGACPVWDCGKTVDNAERVLIRSDGREVSILKTVVPITLDGEEVLLEAFVDITDRKQAEEELRASNAMMVDGVEREKRAAAKLEAAMEHLEDAKEAAEAATRSKSEFLANMSHEIRTPMTAILGFTETMLDPDQSESDKLNAVHTVRRNGEHLLQLINDILDISKIEAGKVEVEHIPCSPVQLVADVQSLMQVRADAKNLPFNIEYIGAVPETIQSDPTRLKQILVNLIGNAIKFTETGGVRLVTRFDDDGAEPNMQFDIVDTGLGMTEEQVGKLFQAFTQADTSTTRKFGGTGLGLMISRRLAEMLGGTITVDSEPGEGSTFRITVTTGPLDGVKMLDDHATATIAQPETAAAPKADADKLDCRILLAEDGPDNQRLITHFLNKAGAEVTVKENGKLAADAALAARDEGSPFDVILMDMQMPVMDGYEATGLLRQKGYTAPIIALTAHAMASDRQKCIDAGCDDYASKPVNRKKLIETVRQHLATPTMAETSA